LNQNFIDYVKSHIKEYLPTEYQNAVISINEVTKSNDRMLTGLTILLPGEQAAPTIYLEALAEQVERGIPKLIGFLKRQEANGKFFSKAMQKEVNTDMEEV